MAKASNACYVRGLAWLTTRQLPNQRHSLIPVTDFIACVDLFSGSAGRSRRQRHGHAAASPIPLTPPYYIRRTQAIPDRCNGSSTRRVSGRPPHLLRHPRGADQAARHQTGGYFFRGVARGRRRLQAGERRNQGEAHHQIDLLLPQAQRDPHSHRQHHPTDDRPRWRSNSSSDNAYFPLHVNSSGTSASPKPLPSVPGAILDRATANPEFVFAKEDLPRGRRDPSTGTCLTATLAGYELATCLRSQDILALRVRPKLEPILVANLWESSLIKLMAFFITNLCRLLPAAGIRACPALSQEAFNALAAGGSPGSLQAGLAILEVLSRVRLQSGADGWGWRRLVVIVDELNYAEHPTTQDQVSRFVDVLRRICATNDASLIFTLSKPCNAVGGP